MFMPLTIIVISWLVSIFISKSPWKKRLRNIALILLLVCSNGFITNTLLKWWEIPPTPLSNLPKSENSVAVVLTGVTHKSKLPHDRVYFYEGADRVLHTVKMYHLGKIKKIIISGGSGRLIRNQIKEAPQLAEIFEMCGVNSEDLIIEDQSRNTRESALAVAKIVERVGPKGDIYLVTSAFHMRRSQACFNKVGLSVIPFSTDFKTSDEPPSVTSLIVPSPGAIFKWHILIKELLGIIAYWFAGYL